MARLSATTASRSRAWGSSPPRSSRAVAANRAGVSGVRSSWLTIARKVSLARLAASAASLASRDARSARF